MINQQVCVNALAVTPTTERIRATRRRKSGGITRRDSKKVTVVHKVGYSTRTLKKMLRGSAKQNLQTNQLFDTLANFPRIVWYDSDDEEENNDTLRVKTGEN